MCREPHAIPPRAGRIHRILGTALAAGVTLLVAIAAIRNPEQLRSQPSVSDSSDCSVAPQGELEKAIAHGDFSALREHAWKKLRSISTPVRQPGDPTWLEWLQKGQVFQPEDRSGSFRWRFDDSFKDRLADAFRAQPDLDLSLLIEQFRNEQTAASAPESEKCPAESDISKLRALSIVSFNPAAADWIMRGAHRFNQREQLNALHGANFIDIPAFPRESIVTKQTWWPIACDRPCPIPVWDGQINLCATTAADESTPFSSWPRIAVLDDAESEGQLIEVRYPAGAGSSRFGRRVHRSRMLIRTFRQLDHKPQLSAARLQFCRLYGRAPTPDDGVGLVALHFITKELPDWLWCTIWWHDEPNVGRFAADRPSSLPTPWNNYLLQVAFDPDKPREEDGTPCIAFNPWIEGRLQGSTTSNCIACHQRAVWPLNGVHVDLPSRGRIPRTDPSVFCLLGTSRMRVDYLWSVAMEAK